MGENLQDHLEVYIQNLLKQPVSVAPALKWNNWAVGGHLCGRWAAAGRGATYHFEGGGFIRSNEDVAYPNSLCTTSCRWRSAMTGPHPRATH